MLVIEAHLRVWQIGVRASSLTVAVVDRLLEKEARSNPRREYSLHADSATSEELDSDIIKETNCFKTYQKSSWLLNRIISAILCFFWDFWGYFVGRAPTTDGFSVVEKSDHEGDGAAQLWMASRAYSKSPMMSNVIEGQLAGREDGQSSGDLYRATEPITPMKTRAETFGSVEARESRNRRSRDVNGLHIRYVS